MQLYLILLFYINFLILLSFTQNIQPILNYNLTSQSIDPLIQLNSHQNFIRTTTNSETQDVNHHQNPPCQCLNQGKCYTIENQNQKSYQNQKQYCNCTRLFIGQKCQHEAEQFTTNRQIFKFINIYQYKYFYFEPRQQNMFSFHFHLCFDSKANPALSSQISNLITFFLNIEDQNGNLQLNQQENDLTTIQLKQDQCKFITIDDTMFGITKLKTIQKFVFALKLGKQINDLPQNTQQNDSQQKQIKKPKKSQRSLKYNITTQINDKNFTYNWTNKRNVTSAPKKKYNLSAFRRIYIGFQVTPFEIDELFQNIVYSLITLAAFIIVAIMIFFLRTRILGIRLIQSLNSNPRLTNDLKHFEIYLPSEIYKRPRTEQLQNPQLQPDLQCSICIAYIEDGEVIRKTHCDHVFHKSCIDSWCVQNLTCPVCRRSFTESKIKQFYNSSIELGSNSDSND